MFNPTNLVDILIQRNPNMVNNPRSQELLQLIKSGDSKRGAEVARNLCQTYGVTPEQASEEAKRFFGIKH